MASILSFLVGAKIKIGLKYVTLNGESWYLLEYISIYLESYLHCYLSYKISCQYYFKISAWCLQIQIETDHSCATAEKKLRAKWSTKPERGATRWNNNTKS